MPYGFKPVRSLYMRGPTPNLYRRYSIADDYATGLFKGDPVAITTDATLIIATVGLNLAGIFEGVEFANDSREVIFRHHWPASQSGSSIRAYVFDDPYLIFMAESDQDTTALVAGDVGENVDFISGTGSTVTGISAYSVDSSTNATGADIGFHIVGSAEEGETFTAAATVMDVYVMPNEHMLKGTVAGV